MKNTLDLSLQRVDVVVTAIPFGAELAVTR